MTTVCITFNSRYNWNAVIWMEDSLTIFPRQNHNSAHSTWTKVSEAIALFLKWQISEEHSPYYWQDRLSNFLVTILFVNWQMRAYQKSGFWDPQHLRVGPRNPGPANLKCLGGIQDLGPPKWDMGSETPKYSSETGDFQFSIVLIVYSTPNTLHFTCYKTLR